MSGIDKNVSLSEAIDIHANDSLTLERVLARECGYARTSSDRTSCELDVRNTALSIGRNAEYQATRSLQGIEAVIRGLARIRERKTLVLVSAGLPIADRSGIDLQLISEVVALGREAAAANLNLFVLHIDSGFLDAFSAEERTISDTLGRDLGMMSTGLETIAGASGGSLARVVAGADFAFDRVLRETAAAYLLGVEPAESDRDGKPHRISVKVRIPNAEVRSRKEFVMPRAEAKPATPDEALAAAFRSDRLQTALPIRVATHSLAGTSNGGNRVIISADIGDAITGPVEMRFLFAFVDASGKTLPPVAQKATLRPRAGGAPGWVSYTSESRLRPGTYTLRFVAVDAAGRVGSVDHAVTVGLKKSETVSLSDLLLVEPRQRTTDDIFVVVDGHVRGEAIDAYLEIAPANAASKVTGVTFGIADSPDGEPLVSAKASVTRPDGAAQWVAAARLSLGLLPPGDYVATATVLADERAVGRVTRPVHIERAAAAPGGAAAGSVSPPRVSFAAGESGSLVKAFSRQDVLGRDTLEYFLDRMRRASPESAADPSVSIAAASLLDARFDRVITNLVTADPTLLSTAFLKGLGLFGMGALEPAAAQFRASLDAAPDFLPAAFYLGACYAAGGRDREAVGAWQATLITESDARIIYDVLGDALLRLQDGDEAASILAEAREKWTDDDRFVPRLAASEACAAGRRRRLRCSTATSRATPPMRTRSCSGCASSTKLGRPAGGSRRRPTTAIWPAAMPTCTGPPAARTRRLSIAGWGSSAGNSAVALPSPDLVVVAGHLDADLPPSPVVRRVARHEPEQVLIGEVGEHVVEDLVEFVELLEVRLTAGLLGQPLEHLPQRLHIRRAPEADGVEHGVVRLEAPFGRLERDAAVQVLAVGEHDDDAPARLRAELGERLEHRVVERRASPGPKALQRLQAVFQRDRGPRDDEDVVVEAEDRDHVLRPQLRQELPDGRFDRRHRLRHAPADVDGHHQLERDVLGGERRDRLRDAVFVDLEVGGLQPADEAPAAARDRGRDLDDLHVDGFGVLGALGTDARPDLAAVAEHGRGPDQVFEHLGARVPRARVRRVLERAEQRPVREQADALRGLTGGNDSHRHRRGPADVPAVDRADEDNRRAGLLRRAAGDDAGRPERAMRQNNARPQATRGRPRVYVISSPAPAARRP